MEQARRIDSLCRGSDVCVASDRREERRAAVVQMMAENREGLGMKVIAVMVQRYGVLPRAMWDLNSISDMGAGRKITYGERLSRAMLESIISNTRYSIISLNILKNVSHKVQLPRSLRRLWIYADVHDFPLDLPENLEEMRFGVSCRYEQPLVLPASLQILKLGDRYNQEVAFPSRLLDLELGSAYILPLDLPPCLKRLVFPFWSQFNLPLVLSPSLRIIELGDSYNQPTLLPSGIEELGVGCGFTHDISLPSTLVKIEWRCNRPIQAPMGVSEMILGSLGDMSFDHLVVLPASLKSFTLYGSTYSYPLKLNDGLEELSWWPKNYEGLVLPEGLHKLTLWSTCNVELPTSLREIEIRADAPLVLPQELVKITFASSSGYHYNLPESVQEVSLEGEVIFTHPSTLEHLIIGYPTSEVDLNHLKVGKLTIEHRDIRITRWPQELKELEFTLYGVNAMTYPLRVPKGVKIVGEKLPASVTLEE